MQEKAWSTGGLKKLILKLIGKNVYGLYKTVIPEITVNNMNVSYEAIFYDKISEVFLINHNKKLVYLFKLDFSQNSTLNIYKLSYIDFISDAIYYEAPVTINMSTASINTNGILFDIKVQEIPYDVGDNVEMIYKTEKYAPNYDI